LLCDTTSPAMSAVVVASEQIGFHAAARLDRLLRGRRDAGGDELIDPISVTTRGSTEAFAIDDPELRQAMIFLRHNAYRPLSVGEIADAVPMARRSLERKFRQMTGRTPLDEIRRLRLNRVKELLAMTDRSVADIADATGFGTPAYMTATFRHAERITPLRYRRQVRGL
jgi:LacI family transcriptional regulator